MNFTQATLHLKYVSQMVTYPKGSPLAGSVVSVLIAVLFCSSLASCSLITSCSEQGAGAAAAKAPQGEAGLAMGLPQTEGTGVSGIDMMLK